MSQSSNSGTAAAPALQMDVDIPSVPSADDQERNQAADRDLTFTLQLLAERALFLTGASSVSIFLDEKGKLVGWAQVPPATDCAVMADEATRESLRERSILCFHDAGKDPRFSRQLCQEMGVKSLMIVPLLTDDTALGAVELRSDRFRAFEERDTAAMEHLAGLMVIAIENAAAAKRTFRDVVLPEVEAPKSVEPKQEPATTSAETKVEAPETSKAEEINAEQPLPRVRTCASCGFPISEGRTICLDCEEADQKPENLSPILTGVSNETWLQANFYTLGIVFMMLATIVLLAIRFR